MADLPIDTTYLHNKRNNRLPRGHAVRHSLLLEYSHGPRIKKVKAEHKHTLGLCILKLFDVPGRGNAILSDIIPPPASRYSTTSTNLRSLSVNNHEKSYGSGVVLLP
jgi:hypothetical protein